MHISKNTRLVGISVLLMIGLGACNKPGPAETAGKNIDSSMDKAGQKMESTTDKVGDKMSEQSIKVGVAADDMEITTKVKAAILAEAGLKTLQISVETTKGVVTLSGSVDSQSHSNTANSLASAVPGVSAVNNKLVVKPEK